jgi:tetratricopeptide (TPR) repeat protein
VAQEMFVRTEAGALDAARANVDRVGVERQAARRELDDAQRAVREADNMFLPERPVRDARNRIAYATERGASQQEIANLQQIASLRQAELTRAQALKESAIAQASERVRVAQATIAAKDAEFAEATRAVSQASEVVESVASRQLVEMTPDEFDAYVAKEIDAIRKGRTTELSVVVSEEQLAAARGLQDELGKRRELLESLRPDLQARYATSRKLFEEAESRYSALLDQYEKANSVLVRMQKAESRNGALPFGGKDYPPEYVAARAAQQEALKKVQVAQKRLDDLTKQSVKLTAEVNAARAAGAETATLELARDEAAGRLSLLQNALELMGREEGARPAWVKAVNRKDWDSEFDDVKREVEAVVRALNALPRETVGRDVDRVWATWTKYLESRANVLLSKDDWAQAVQLERLGAAGVLNSDNMVWSMVVDEGFVKLEGSGSAANFTNLQMRPEVAEILSNMGRIKDGAFVRQMRRWMVPYTKFFKAWALATPGFHVRNSITNGFMMIAAGGRPDFLYEAMIEYNKMHRFLKQGRTFSEYLDTIGDATQRQRVADAYRAMSGSGVGQSEEVLFDTSSIITNNPITRTSRKAGTWVESHSRFMLAYDGIRQGYDVSSATARVRKFLFDYEDVSKLDATMRQIVPFWTWTSRNVPLTIQNIYLNPRPYQIYQSFKRNAQDDERTQALPLYMREAGAFAIPGTDMAATPELGFNRLAADVSMLSDPMRIAANVNPLLRVPTETVLANKSFFRNRQFQQQPLPVEGPVGTLASLLGQPVGMGQSQGGQRYVDERLLYGLTNLVPTLNQVERFVPSQEYYQQRGSTNPLLGMLGAPVREVTPEMTTSEQRRRLAEIQKLLASQPKPEGQ